MKSELKKLLKAAENSTGWNANSRTPWLPIVDLMTELLELDNENFHAIKIQSSSARKSLWQGKLHRRPITAILVAVDEPCDDADFERISLSVTERFSPPSAWADACMIFSDGVYSGCVERDGVGLAQWIRADLPTSPSVFCNSLPDQVRLAKRLKDSDVSATKLVGKLSGADANTIRALVAESIGLSKDEVIASVTGVPSNVAKGRWEGGDVDPERRYRVAVVSTSEWDWGTAALEIMTRMDPPELSVDLVLLCAKTSDASGWNRYRGFLAANASRREDFLKVLNDGGVDDVRIVERLNQAVRPAKEILPERKSLKVRDADAGDVQYEVSRSKQRVHDAITNWLVEWGKQEAKVIREGSDSRALYDAVIEKFPDNANLLVEVKSTAELGAIRLAVGQLIDYRRVLGESGPSPSCVLLIPPNELLTQDMKDLLKLVGFSWATILHRPTAEGRKLVLRIHSNDGTTAEYPQGN